MPKPHSLASVGARHPRFDIVYNDLAAMASANGSFSSVDVGKEARVLSPLSHWLLSEQSSGTARWILETLCDWPTAGAEIDTGLKIGSNRVYMQRFTGTTSGTGGNEALTSSGDLVAPLSAEGWIDDGAGPRQIGMGAISSTNYCSLHVVSSDLNLYHDGGFDTADYDILVTYTK